MAENEDNILTMEREPEAEQAPAQAAKSTADGAYPLDWKTTTVPLAHGKFKHKLNRPTSEQIFDREKQLNREIPISKGGGMAAVDPTEAEEINAAFYDVIAAEATGYKGTVPAAHKSAAIDGLYRRTVYIDDGVDEFAEEVPVTEEIGPDDAPDFTIVHVLRQPSEDELRRYRRRSASSEIKPGKRGRQVFVTKSNLKNAVEFYDLLSTSIAGAKLDDTPGYDHLALAGAVDPLIKRLVVDTFVDKIVGSLLD